MTENNNLRLWVHVAEVDGLDVIQLPAYGTKDAAEQGLALYGEQDRARVRVVPLTAETPAQALPNDLQACSWLVTGGRLYKDKPFLREEHARQSLVEREDDARVIPLAPLVSLVAHYADVSEAAKAYRRGADVASVESGFIAGAEWQRSQASAAPELWAVHVQGPDELYAAFSREDADQYVAALNALPMPPGMKADALGAVVIRSPWSEAEHWRYLAEQERDHKSDLIAAALKRQGQLKGAADAAALDVMQFQLKHPVNGETRTVEFTRAEIAALVEFEIFEKLADQLCECGGPVGETNHVDHNCDEYADEFELVKDAAPAHPDAALVEALRNLLSDDDIRHLRRFQEICEDSDADGHDLPKEAVRRLERAGAMRSCGFGRHETTLFGDAILEALAGKGGAQ